MGERVRESVACRFRARVRWVVNTHAHAETCWATAPGPAWMPLRGRLWCRALPPEAAMGQRCPACLASLTARVGGAAMAGTGIVLPDRVLQAGDVLPVGRMRLVVQPFERGHSEGDLVLWNPAHRVVWVGGLVYSRRVPELAQGRLDDWLVALDHLEALAPAHVVSAAVSSRERAGDLPEALGETRAYLMALRQGVLQAMDEGHQPQEAGLVPLPAFSSWAGYAQRHAFNVQRAWRELEPVWMDRAP
ncbi:MAG: MBL fold metallo-hydrolase [Burkholderiaceae bacterium]